MNLNFFSEDLFFVNRFRRITGPSIYRSNISENYISCIFCANLERTQCHEYCFSCSKGIYPECSTLLPGTYSFSGSYFDSLGTDHTPWIFKTPCTRFERLNLKKYFRNFVSPDRNVTTANYETIEGLFTGISRGKRPCHICASVNMGIYNSCSKLEKVQASKPCTRITGEIARIYKSIAGMIKYAE